MTSSSRFWVRFDGKATNHSTRITGLSPGLVDRQVLLVFISARSDLYGCRTATQPHYCSVLHVCFVDLHIADYKGGVEGARLRRAITERWQRRRKAKCTKQYSELAAFSQVESHSALLERKQCFAAGKFADCAHLDSSTSSDKVDCRIYQCWSLQDEIMYDLTGFKDAPVVPSGEGGS